MSDLIQHVCIEVGNAYQVQFYSKLRSFWSDISSKHKLSPVVYANNLKVCAKGKEKLAQLVVATHNSICLARAACCGQYILQLEFNMHGSHLSALLIL